MPKMRFRSLNREPQVPRLEEALDFLDTKIGACLLRPGATLHRNTRTTPSNIWIESKAGTMLHHSESDRNRVCPLSSCWGLLQPFLQNVEKKNGDTGQALTAEVIAEHARRKLAKSTKPAKALSQPKLPRL
jgi:hypothetical protein